MKIALLSDANSPGPFRHIPSDGLVNSIEALTRALDCEIWHGRDWTPMLAAHFAAYDALIVNLKWPLWPVIPRLVRELPKVRIFGYQEEAADLIGELQPEQLRGYLDAQDALDSILCYDRRALDWLALIARARTYWLPYPAPLPKYASIPPHPETPASPIAVAVPLTTLRGAALSLAVAAHSTGRPVLTFERTIAGAAAAARLIALQSGIPDIRQWTEWHRARRQPPQDRFGWTMPEPPCFLEALSGCFACVNLDTRACYGRLQLDCAGVGVPCIGDRRSFLQDFLWPSLAVRGYEDVALVRKYLNDDWEGRTRRKVAVDFAQRRMAAALSVAAIRRRWDAIWEKEKSK